MLRSDLVVNVKVPLVLVLADHPGLLQEEVGDLPPVWLSPSAELDLKVFTLRKRKTLRVTGGVKGVPVWS